MYKGPRARVWPFKEVPVLSMAGLEGLWGPGCSGSQVPQWSSNLILTMLRSPGRIFSRNLPFRKGSQDAEGHGVKAGRPLRRMWQRCRQETVWAGPEQRQQEQRTVVGPGVD